METIAHRRSRGFTLIELLMVIAIMMIMMGIAMFGFVDWGRGTGMRAAVLNFKGAFSQARSHAITHRVRTQLHYGNLPPPGLPPGPPAPGIPPWRGYYYVATEDDGVIGTTNVFPEGVVISNPPPILAGPFDDVFVEFKLDGSCESDADDDDTSADEWDFGQTRQVVLIEERSVATTNYLSATLEMYRAQGSIMRRMD